MQLSRPLTIATGVTLLGVTASLVVRAVCAPNGNGKRREHNTDAAVPYGRGVRIERAFTILSPAPELYARWRDLASLPAIMSHLERVEVIDERRSRWTAKGPANLRATWEAEIIEDEPGRRIAWRSVSGNVPNAGSVRFREAPGDRGTELHLEMEWAPPGGPLGSSLAHFIGDNPGLMVNNDLRRFKATIEAGHVALNSPRCDFCRDIFGVVV
jgi:uncharacterized membrane protein